MVDFKEIRNIGQLRDARMELRGALDSQRRALELSLSHLKESWKPANVVRLAFRGMAVDLSETVLHLGLRLKDYILRKWEEKKSRRDQSSPFSEAGNSGCAADGNAGEESRCTEPDKAEDNPANPA